MISHPATRGTDDKGVYGSGQEIVIPEADVDTSAASQPTPPGRVGGEHAMTDSSGLSVV